MPFYSLFNKKGPSPRRICGCLKIIRGKPSFLKTNLLEVFGIGLFISFLRLPVVFSDIWNREQTLSANLLLARDKESAAKLVMVV